MAAKGPGDPYDQRDTAAKRPWSRQEFPTVAGWLAASEKPLALIAEASKRPRRFDPLVPVDGVLRAMDHLPRLRQHLRAGKGMLARAMLRAHEGDVPSAWQDLLACHRLARLIAQGPTLDDACFGMWLESAACAADQGLLQHVRLTAGQAAAMYQDLARLAPLPAMAEKIDAAGRFAYLDGVAVCAREGYSSIFYLGEGQRPVERSRKRAGETLVDAAIAMRIDWDQVLRDGNGWCDRIAAAYRKPTAEQRRRELRKVRDEIGKLRGEVKAGTLFDLPPRSGRAAPSHILGAVLVPILLPESWDLSYEWEDRETMRFKLNLLAFALAACRVEHGDYPTRLANLAPEYVAAVPKDIFSDSDLHYRRDGEGYLLYSVGPNGRDDGGKGRDVRDAQHGEPWDDIVVRMPGAAK